MTAQKRNLFNVLGMFCLLFYSGIAKATTFLQSQEIPQSEYIRDDLVPSFFYFHSGMFFGTIVMLLFVNLFFYIAFKDKIFLYYIFLVFTTNLAFIYHEGLFRDVFKNYFFKYDFDMVSHYLQVLAGYLFTKHFLNLPFHYPKLDKILQWIVVLIGFVFLGYFLNFNFQWISIANLLGIFLFVFFWLLSFTLFKKEPSAKVMALGFSMIIITGFFQVVFSERVIPVIGSTTNLYKLGALLEAAILTYAAIFKSRKLQEENDIIKRDIQSYLTQIVHLESTIKEISEQKNQSKEDLELLLVKLAKDFDLTDREADILLHITKGYSNKEICDELYISINTVKYHTRNLYEKLDVKNRTEITTKLMLDK